MAGQGYSAPFRTTSVAGSTFTTYEQGVPDQEALLDTAHLRGHFAVVFPRPQPSSDLPLAEEVPSLVSDSETSSDSGDSISLADDHAAGAFATGDALDRPHISPSADAGNLLDLLARTANATSTQSHDLVISDSHTAPRDGAEAHGGGLYSVAPSVADYAFGAGSDLLTNLAAMPAFIDAVVDYPTEIELADEYLPETEDDTRRKFNPAMTRWLNDDADSCSINSVTARVCSRLPRQCSRIFSSCNLMGILCCRRLEVFAKGIATKGKLSDHGLNRAGW